MPDMNTGGAGRRRYCGSIDPKSSTPGLVPVTITPEPIGNGGGPPIAVPSPTIEIEVCGLYRVCVGERTLRRVLNVFRQPCRQACG